MILYRLQGLRLFFLTSCAHLFRLSASMKFDFDVCNFKADLLDSVESFHIGNELGYIVDRYIAPEINGTIFVGDMAFVDEIKSFILDYAQPYAIQIKASIADTIRGFSCSRRLDIMDIGHDGSQRLLELNETFGSLVDQILVIDGVQSATAGFDLARMEVALDIALRVENVFNASFFQIALSTLFDKVAPSQAIFGAADEVATVGNLFNELEVIAAYWLSISAGTKVNASFKDFFDSFSSDITPDTTGFLRIVNLGASVYAQADNMSFELFPGISNVTDASIELQIGVELWEPHEFSLDSSDIGFNEIVSGRLRFEPRGNLAASFPFSVTIGSVSQDFQVLFNDDNLFDEEEVLVTVNYNACRFLDVFQQILGKLGAIKLSPENILGPTAIESLDSLFPDLGGFLTGVLEGECTNFCPNPTILRLKFSLNRKSLSLDS